jgi:hypothetical protein
MSVRSGQVITNLIQVSDKIASYMETRMVLLATALQFWAETEHLWLPDRPHTEGTITAFVSEVTPLLITIRVQVDQDAGLWLELARSGRYAWLWPMFFNHQHDIARILGGNEDAPLDIVPNPDVQSQFDELKVAYRTARGSTKA